MQITNLPASRNFGRRQFIVSSVAALASSELLAAADKDDEFRFRFILSSCMYGYASVEDILPEVAKVGAQAIDIWPKVHGNQREQLDELGEARFTQLLGSNGVQLGCITQYKLGPFRLQEEMQLAKRFKARTIVCGGEGPRGLRGSELKAAVAAFIEKLKPHLEVAEACGVKVAIENHGNNLIESPDSLKWLAELRPSKHLAIALAPYHLPQNETLLAKLIRSVGPAIEIFYAWQHGMGCMKKLPKKQELLQMPGRGKLDFQPIIEALTDINYSGWTSIFMHPVPRGIPILETTSEVTAEINRARQYLLKQLSQV